MAKKYLLFLTVISFLACRNSPPVANRPAQTGTAEPKWVEPPVYRSAYTRKMDLMHTRLSVAFNFPKKELYGQAAIILRPHFYPGDSLVLNARGMELKEVSLVTLNKHIKLNYNYDGELIRIKLDKTYTRDESFTIFIDYISRPENLTSKGSEAISETRGLYFINGDKSDKDYPTQVWSQGETESNSSWFPTIEDPSQKMTQEIYITVDSTMKTLSNGLLLSSEINPDGTRTDYWKQSLPAAPYLTMIAAGDFAIVKDKWKNIDVNYYVDPPYEKYARLTFGRTPEMISYFSDLLGIPYVWEKYSQIVVHDYISGAMENTTATVHGTNMQQDPREYADEKSEEYISHELFHHWFGDLVTCESWSNLTLNEGFANYAEYLWREHADGKEAADYANQIDLSTYMLTAANDDPPLIRFNYDNREDLYDAISYNKGGRVLHMLRDYVGDDAFFSTLHDYLSSHMFSTAEIHDLRMAFEKTTGEDLNWFFNQWFMQGGHPVLKIDYEWNDSLKQQTVTISQLQKPDKAALYRLPLAVDLYYNGKTERQNIVLEKKEQQFTFSLPSEPDLVNVDATKTLLCSKTDNKPVRQYLFQFDHAPLYVDKYESVVKIGESYRKGTPEAGVMMRALHDKFFGIRLAALQNIGELAMNAPDTVKSDIIALASNDPVPAVRERALIVLGKYYSFKDNQSVFVNAITKDSSYKVNARAFKIMNEKDPDAAGQYATLLENDSSSIVLVRLSEYYKTSRQDRTAFFKRAFKYCDALGRYYLVNNLEDYIVGNDSPEIIGRGIAVMTGQAQRPQVSFVKQACRNSLDQVEKSLDKKIDELQALLQNPGDRKPIDIQSDISQFNTIRKNLKEEIAQLEKSDK